MHLLARVATAHASRPGGILSNAGPKEASSDGHQNPDQDDQGTNALNELVQTESWLDLMGIVKASAAEGTFSSSSSSSSCSLHIPSDHHDFLPTEGSYCYLFKFPSCLVFLHELSFLSLETLQS